MIARSSCYPGVEQPGTYEGNISVFDFELSEDDMARIAALNRNEKHDWYIGYEERHEFSAEYAVCKRKCVSLYLKYVTLYLNSNNFKILWPQI